MVPDTWLNDQNLYICHHCSSLVAISHKSSHIKKCLKCPPSPESPVATPLTKASGDDLPSLRDICNLKCPTIRFIPNKAKPAFARVLSAALRAVITENSIGSWIKLFMLPKCVLPCSKRRGRHNKPIPLEVLCDMWTDGHFGDLWSRAVKHATCTSKSYSLHPKVDPGRRKVASAISLAQDGLFGKACQVLTSSGVAPNNDDTWNLLISKHPSSACPAIPLPSNRDFTFPPDLSLMDILRSFPKLTAAGPSGLRIQHLIDAAEVPLQTPLLHTLRAVINLLISGSAPLDVAIFLAGGNLTALNKPVPGDIHPIAVGEALQRLTGKCLCAALRSKMASFFEPYQFGVAFPCGAEKIAHGLRTCIEQHWSENDFGVLKVDMTNAFNLVSRQAILSECAKHFPELLPWVSWCYGQHPLLWHHLCCLTSESGVQQGDPLGPLLFSLVLNILVMKVARDSACSNLPFHAWYLDDGVMAGPRSSLCRILSLLQEEGPALGIIANLPKCEAFSRHGLDMFPLRMKKSDKPSLEILGIPIGDQEFCSSFISKKHTKAKILLSLLEEVGIVDPQVALILLRLCGAFCKLVHLARATPSTLTSKVFALIDDDIRMTFCRCIGVDMSDTAWQQAQFSPSRGGLGFRSLSRHSLAAFISSLCSSGFDLQSSHHLSQAIETFNSLVSPADAVSVESLLTSSVSQKYLSGKLDDRVFNMLLNSSSVADKARLLSVSSPHAASWLSVVPSENLGLHLDPPVFQVAIKWWLGLDTSEGSQCALCPGSTLDHLGHHAVTCKYGGDVVSRHNRIRDILVETCRQAHIGVKVEVGNNLSRDHSKTRPADILLPNWFLGRTAALDVSITSPLNPVTLLEAGVSATAAAQATEARKHKANDPKCSELGWVCVPMVVETYGAWGKEATAIISSVASRLATSTYSTRSMVG